MKLDVNGGYLDGSSSNSMTFLRAHRNLSFSPVGKRNYGDVKRTRVRTARYASGGGVESDEIYGNEHQARKKINIRLNYW